MSRNNSTPNITIERRFDITADISKDWFRSYVSELVRYGGDNPDDVNCDVHLAPDFDNRVAFDDRQVWLDYVLENWTDITETNIFQHAGVVKRARCNHQLHHVILSVEGKNSSDIERTFELVSGVLSLRLSPRNPYRYRRSSLEFEIGNWRPDLFVLGVKGISGLLVSDPSVPEAYAKTFEGDIEKLISFFDLKSFCEGIGTRASRFGEIGIRIQARSMAVGITVTSDHKKLRIRTSIPPDELDKLISAWPEELKLKSVKVADTGADAGGSPPPPSENPWLKYGLPVVVAFITAASTAGAISLKKAIWPDYKVIITSPAVTNGIATWSGNDVSVDWYLQPDQASFRGVKKGVVATVRLHTPSGFQSPVESKPPFSISLTPGNYVVSVDTQGATPAQFQLVVQKSSSQNDQPRP